MGSDFAEGFIIRGKVEADTSHGSANLRFWIYGSSVRVLQREALPVTDCLHARMQGQARVNVYATKRDGYWTQRRLEIVPQGQNAIVLVDNP